MSLTSFLLIPLDKYVHVNALNTGINNNILTNDEMWGMGRMGRCRSIHNNSDKHTTVNSLFATTVYSLYMYMYVHDASFFREGGGGGEG